MNEHYLSRNNHSVNPRKLKEYYAALAAGFATMDAERPYKDAISLKDAGFGVSTMDAQVAAQSGYNIPGLNQFLQNWLPGAIRMFTAPRRAEELLGFVQAGDFADQTIVARFVEMFGYTQSYGDLNEAPRSGYNAEYQSREIVRFQGGVQSDRLETQRMAKIGVSDIDEKRTSLARAFAITENLVSFNGFTGARCYGLLNDPNLPSYVTVASSGTGSSPLWSAKTSALQWADVLTSVQALFTQTKTAFDPTKEEFTWAIGTAVKIALSNFMLVGGTALAISLGEYIKQQFPNIRIIVIPEFDGANGGANIWYMYKESMVDGDTSSDDGKAVVNLIQQRMFMLSALPTASGGIAENYASAQAGTFVKRPILFYRASGM